MRKTGITLAVLGTGSIGMRHIGVLSALGARVIAVPARPERAAELAGQGLTSVRSLEEAKRIGAAGVIVCTDTSRHVRDCLEACGLGMAIFCEKPLAVSSKEAGKLGEIGSENVHVAYNLGSTKVSRKRSSCLLVWERFTIWEQNAVPIFRDGEKDGITGVTILRGPAKEESFWT